MEAAGVEPFHILWFLPHADSKKKTKDSEAYFAGAIVRVSYTEKSYRLCRNSLFRLRASTLDLLVLQARHSFSTLDRECSSLHIPLHATVSYLSIILKYAREEEGR